MYLLQFASAIVAFVGFVVAVASASSLNTGYMQHILLSLLFASLILFLVVFFLFFFLFFPFFFVVLFIKKYSEVQCSGQSDYLTRPWMVENGQSW